MHGHQKYCLKPACREAQNEATKKYRRAWWKANRTGQAFTEKELGGETHSRGNCHLCGRPLVNGERMNHLTCIANESRRIDGDYLYI